uniref:Protein-cysteine N-palmitoyltransferase Rasp n=1 Tax=Plectus sambesii TaxID=2011161 RepID=A0A914XTP6_9BILA
MPHRTEIKHFTTLPLPENLFYLSMTIGHALFAIATVYENSKYLELPYGRTLFGFTKDTYDTEWVKWTDELPLTVLTLLLHSVVFNLGSRVLNASTHGMLCLAFWTILHFALYSITTLFECFIFALVCLVTVHRLRRMEHTNCRLIGAALIWTYALIWLFMMNNTILVFDNWNASLLKAYKLFQIVSYSLVLIGEQDPLPSIRICSLELLAYCIYWPTSTILIVPYASFREQMTKRAPKLSPADKRRLLFMALRVAFWTVLAEISTAFLYQAAYMQNPDIMEDEFTSSWQYFSVAYTASQFFHTMYMSIFGIPALFASLDGLSTISFPPICTAHASLFSKVWRYFDRGLYAFLSIHLFRPIARVSDELGLSYRILGRLLAGATAFVFVYLWHGASVSYYRWAMLNMLEFSLELFGRAVWNHFDLHEQLSSHLSQRNIRRLVCLFHVPCLFISFASITYFFGTHNGATGDLIWKVFFTDRLFQLTWSGLYSIFFLYCHAQTCYELDEWVGFR